MMSEFEIQISSLEHGDSAAEAIHNHAIVLLQNLEVLRSAAPLPGVPSNTLSTLTGKLENISKMAADKAASAKIAHALAAWSENMEEKDKVEATVQQALETMKGASALGEENENFLPVLGEKIRTACLKNVGEHQRNICMVDGYLRCCQLCTIQVPPYMKSLAACMKLQAIQQSLGDSPSDEQIEKLAAKIGEVSAFDEAVGDIIAAYTVCKEAAVSVVQARAVAKVVDQHKVMIGIDTVDPKAWKENLSENIKMPKLKQKSI
eukprot:6486138-Amphidinium_carterae.4